MTHLNEYLSYYSSLDAPGYAVLVTGAWGTGKTYQVLECLPKDKRIYVSLYGVQSVAQVHAEVFAAAHPKMATARGFFDRFKGKDVGAMGVTIPLGFVPEIANVFLRNEVRSDRILIFDDLERSNLELSEVLGAINSYVEHKEFRVVVIAHENDKLVSDDFRSVKEKTFGQTLLVQPQVDKALDQFLNNIKISAARDFATKHKAQVLGVFLSSGVKSLRVLRHAVEDISRLHSVLKEDHLRNAEAMIELVQLFTALNVEVRSSRLTEKDLRNRRGSRIGHNMRVRMKDGDKHETPPFVTSSDRYSAVDLEAGILNDDVLVSMLVQGKYPLNDIQCSMDNSPHFLVPGEVPPWKVVIQFDELDDETVEEARQCMEQQFRKREVTDSGEMLHIFCLRMMMAENGISERTVDQVVDESMAYINDLLNERRLPPRGSDWRWYDEFSRSHGGFAYWVSDANADHFRAIWDHLVAAREEALRQTFPEVQKALLNMVREDSKAFFEAVSPTNNGHNPYAMIPLLHEIPASDFVDAWLAGKQENWRNVDHALQNRFSHGQLERDLQDEKNWALEILRELDARSKKETGFRALRILRLRPRVLIELAQSEEEPPTDHSQ